MPTDDEFEFEWDEVVDSDGDLVARVGTRVGPPRGCVEVVTEEEA